MVSTLQELAINPISPRYAENLSTQGGTLAGLTFVLTGALSRPRPEFERMIADAGVKQRDLSQKTNYLVAGEGGGSKRDKAVKLGVSIINEDVLLKMLKGDADEQ